MQCVEMREKIYLQCRDEIYMIDEDGGVKAGRILSGTAGADDTAGKDAASGKKKEQRKK